MKSYLSLFVTTIFASSAAFGSTFIFMGSDGDLSKASNWATVTSGYDNTSSRPVIYDSTKCTDTTVATYTQATNAPTQDDIASVMLYFLGSLDENGKPTGTSTRTNPPLNVFLGESATYSKMYMRRDNGLLFKVGSSTASTSSDFLLSVKGDFAILYSGTTASMTIDSKAAQKSFSVSIGGATNIQGDPTHTYAIGDSQRAFDSFSTKTFTNSIAFSTYVKNFEVTSNATIGAVWTANVVDETLSASQALIDIGGKLTKNTGGSFVFDFTDVDFSVLAADDYVLISAASTQGFDMANPYTDISLWNMDLDADKYSLAWNNSNLVLRVVPEPSSIALFFGGAALILSLIRRRK